MQLRYSTKNTKVKEFLYRHTKSQSGLFSSISPFIQTELTLKQHFLILIPGTALRFHL